MLRPFIVDKEKNLRQSKDLLGTTCYANQLVKTIQNIPEEQSCTIGLYGSWGSGKSTIIETAKQTLEAKEDKNYKVIVYDAWKYSGDSFRRMFLLQLQNKLGIEASEEMNRFYTATTEELTPHASPRPVGIIIGAFVLAVCLVGALCFWMFDNSQCAIPITIIAALGSLLLTIFGGFFYELKITQTKNILFAPEQFEECFRQMMKCVLHKKSWYSKIYSRVKDFVLRTETIYDLDKLVIVIDNLDRCDANVVFSMLTDIKTFLGCEKYDVVFVIPVDHEAIKKHLFAKRDVPQISNDDRDSWRDAEEFLRKFFNVIIRIRKHQPMDMHHYALCLNEQYALHYNPDTISIIAKEFAKNPRRIVQLFNNLSIELELYDEKFAKKHETLICIILILREEYPDSIPVLYANPMAWESIDNGDMSPDVSELQTKLEDNKITFAKIYEKDDEFISFMRLAKRSFCNADPMALARIIANTDNILSTVPISVKDAIRTYDTKSLLESLRHKEDRADIEDYMIYCMTKDAEIQASGALLDFIILFAKVNVEFPLTNHTLNKLDELAYSHYSNISEYKQDPNALCTLANSLEKIGKQRLKNLIVQYVSLEENQQIEESTYVSFAHAVISNFISEYDCIKLSKFAERYFDSYGGVPKEIELTETQRHFLLTDAYVERLMSRITDLNNAEAFDALIWAFTNLTGLTSKSSDMFLKGVDKYWHELTGKSTTEVVKQVENVLPVLRSIKSALPSAQLCETVYADMNRAHKLSPSYPTTVSIFGGAHETEIPIMVDFLFEILRLSAYTISVSSTVLTLIKKNEECVSSKLFELSQNQIPLTLYVDSILEIKNYSKKENLLLIQNAFCLKKGDSYLVSDDQATNKLNDMLKADDHQYDTFLVDLISDARMKACVASVLLTKKVEYINKMSSKLLPLVMDAYAQETRDDYASNYMMLEIVLKKGTPAKKQWALDTIEKHLMDGVDIDENLQLILNIDWSAKPAKMLMSSLSMRMETWPEEQQKLAQSFIDKYTVSSQK